MKPWIVAAVGMVVGILLSQVAAQIVEVWSRLDRIEHYLSLLSQTLQR